MKYQESSCSGVIIPMLTHGITAALQILVLLFKLRVLVIQQQPLIIDYQGINFLYNRPGTDIAQAAPLL
jgi:hypothetical protein